MKLRKTKQISKIERKNTETTDYHFVFCSGSSLNVPNKRIPMYTLFLKDFLA